VPNNHELSKALSSATMDIGGYWWILVDVGGCWWMLVGTSAAISQTAG
jgi:hypothetical protein